MATSARILACLISLTALASGRPIGLRGNNNNSSHVTQRGLQECAELPTNLYFHLVNHEAHLSLHVDNGSLDDGANVVYEYLDDGFHDTFRLVKSGLGNFYHIMAQHSNKAITVAGSSLEGGANIVQQELADTTNQDWCFLPNEDGYYRIQNRNSGQIIMADWEPNVPNAGKNVYQWWYWGGKQQAWRLDYTASAPAAGSRPAECVGFPPNTFYHIINENSGLSLRQRSLSNRNTVQSNILAGNLDNWRMVAAGNGHYMIMNQRSGLALSPDPSDGMNLLVKAADASSEWCFSSAGDGYFEIRNKQTGYSIDVQNWALEHLANVATWPYYGGANQKFRLELSAADAEPIAPIAPTQPPTPPPNNDHITSWAGPFETPVVGVSLANFPNGKILLWSAYMREVFGYDTGKTWTALYDPATEDLSELLVSNTNHDMFCPGTATLTNGDMMVTGGADAAVTSIYHYETNTFSTGASMVIPRGYHAMAVLGSGEIFTAGGSWHGEVNAAGEVPIGGRDGEIWSPFTDAWRLLPGVPVGPLLTQDTGGEYRSDNHFWLFQSPVENMLFHAGPSKQMAFINTSGAGSIIPSVVRENQDRMNGNALMIDIGIVFIVGGAANYDTGAGTTKAFLVDINDPANVESKQVGSLEFARTLSNSVLLPGGKVVVTGGQSETLLFSDDFAVMQTEIFDPATETFTTLPDQMRIPRTYHTAAILMIDGRVMVAGGGLCGGCTATHNDFEILTPPYLLQEDGSLAPRPIISSAPTVTTAGATIQISMSDTAFYSFELIRTSSVTHSVNNDQRRIPLLRTNKRRRVSVVEIPSNRNVALVGTYYLFAINANGVPSVGKSIQIEFSGPAPTLSPTVAATTSAPTAVPTAAPIVTTATGVNLLANPSFEDFVPPVANNAWGTRNAVGWTSLNGNKIEVWGENFKGIPAITGRQIIELDYSGNGAPDGIYQDIPTEEGRSYTLSFYMRTRTTSNNSNAERVVVAWAGTVVETFTAPTAQEWHQMTVVLVGTAGATDRLLLREVNNGNGQGPLLDEVSLVAM